jgi:hypothetical protein
MLKLTIGTFSTEEHRDIMAAYKYWREQNSKKRN